jgi:hypothetical protein
MPNDRFANECTALVVVAPPKTKKAVSLSAGAEVVVQTWVAREVISTVRVFSTAFGMRGIAERGGLIVVEGGRREVGNQEVEEKKR